ncbi:hypothetical protein CSC62_14095 [Pseudoxanthomonas jiangsuensis]|uniref:phage tail terminator protein n=1 Tax=Pseudoxanthomonas jiangsuensis TaxID=619688 RepID=UPI001391E448|nr:hypothetical protein [Pseudoxanthomonas jiangsuensis]KAF1692761.1 hypothetical protein CSC62_14095 [Pseudoxanthomonas jiangsuensis]
MSVAPFPVAQVLQRLEERKHLIKLIDGAAGLRAALDQAPRVAPAVFVTTAEIGKPIKYTGPVAIQNCDVTVRCVLFVQNLRGQGSGAAAAEEMAAVIAEVRGALFGWTPADAFDALAFQAGRDESYHAGWLCNQQVFGTNYRMQQQVTA